MSEEGMIPNDSSNINEEIPQLEPQVPATEGGEQQPEAEVEQPSMDVTADSGDVEIEALPADEHDAETDDQADAYPDAGVEEEEPAEVSDEEQDALFDNTGDSAQELLTEIMGDISNFDATVEKSEAKELLLLMETIASRGKVSDFAQKVLNIKKSFEKKALEETAEPELASRFQTAFAVFNKKKSAYYADREREKEANSAQKRELLERLKQIVAEEQVQKIQEVREIQSKWREIGWVQQKDLQALGETYRQYLDIFYNLRSKYQELLDYDRKVNMDEKKKMIEEIEGLIPTEEGLSREEWTARSAKVKSLQEVWRTVGLVPRESLEEINSSYRNVLERFYELRHSYFELQDQQKTENANAKRALIERLKPYLEYTADKAKTWNEATKKVLATQEEWKKIGPGPLEENKQLWKEYRHICDTFFTRKGDYFKGFDDQRTENYRIKLEICEQAEAAMDSTDWKEGAKLLKELQEKWKHIGPVQERHSNKIWKRFRKACDTFFERRSAASNTEKGSLDENLKTKEALIAKLEALIAEDSPSVEVFQEIQTTWKATGHVPFKQKDKINNAFKELIGKFFDKNRHARHEHPRRKVEEDLSSLSSGDDRVRRLQGEIRKLRIRVQEMEGKVSQYEINIQYISKGKSGESLRNQIQGQIDAEKAKIKDIRAKMKEFQKMIDNPPAKEEAAPEPVVESPSEEATES